MTTSITILVAILVGALIILTVAGMLIRRQMRHRLSSLRPTMRVSLTLSPSDTEEDEHEQRQRHQK